MPDDSNASERARLISALENLGADALSLALDLAELAHDAGYGIGYRNAMVDAAEDFPEGDDPGDSFEIWINGGDE